jgi:7-cyano-7-deazaguanine reductase
MGKPAGGFDSIAARPLSYSAALSSTLEVDRMATIPDLKEQYNSLDRQLTWKGEEAIDSRCLLAFQYEYPEQESEVNIDTDEFTAVCPWTGLPDYGNLYISYVPSHTCIELKSLKFYLLSYRDVGVVQEHAANRILRDLVALCRPRRMKVTLDYKVRGGLHTSVSVEHLGEHRDLEHRDGEQRDAEG